MGAVDALGHPLLCGKDVQRPGVLLHFCSWYFQGNLSVAGLIQCEIDMAAAAGVNLPENLVVVQQLPRC